MIKKKINIAVIGLGYVGLPLLISLSKKFRVIGLDIDKRRIQKLSNNIDENNEVSKKILKKFSKNIKFTSNYNQIQNSNIFIVTLPTPVFKNNKPDLRLVKSCCVKISNLLKKNDVIVFESTLYPGATRNVFVPLIEKRSGLKLNSDFFCGYSPERINPGDKINQLENINKIVSGSNNKALDLIYYIYSSIIKADVYKAKSIEIAEAAKVIENCQRDINVAFVNELSLILNKLNINTNEVLKAASTKWNFLNFKPGLVGGHCIGVDPYYLTYIAKKNGYNPEIILKGRKLNDSMGVKICKKIDQKLKSNKINKKKLQVLVLGYAFKENCNDIRNTKVKDIYNYFKIKKNIVEIYDPLIKKSQIENKLIKDFLVYPKLNFYDVIIICVSHDIFKKMGFNKVKSFGKKNSLIFDIKNLFPNKKIMYL
mgnify:CR=1 FL=1